MLFLSDNTEKVIFALGDIGINGLSIYLNSLLKDTFLVFFQTVKALNYLKEEHGVIHRGMYEKWCYKPIKMSFGQSKKPTLGHPIFL